MSAQELCAGNFMAWVSIGRAARVGVACSWPSTFVNILYTQLENNLKYDSTYSRELQWTIAFDFTSDFWFYFSTSAKFPDQSMPQRITSRLIQNSSNTLSWVYSEQVIIYETSVYSADMHQNPNQLYWPSMCRCAKNGASFSFSFFCSHSIYPNKQTYNSNLYSTFIFIYTVVQSAKMLEYIME